MSIFNINGDLKYNIYGPNWDAAKTNFFRKVVFCNDKIVASFQGESGFDWNATKLIVFNTEGDYIKTLETGYNIIDFCFDKDNNRIIMGLDDEIQIACLYLDGII
jgi:hypothetical protein